MMDTALSVRNHHMCRSLFQIRAVFAALFFGVALVLGLSAAMASAPSCATPVGMHQVDDPGFAVGSKAACQDQGCVPDPTRCCTGMIAGSCGATAFIPSGTPFPLFLELELTKWLVAPVLAPPGLDPRAGRRPPRFAA